MDAVPQVIGADLSDGKMFEFSVGFSSCTLATGDRSEVQLRKDRSRKENKDRTKVRANLSRR
jgi:hypothetical protein